MVDALASSIAYGEDLGDTMRRLAQDIAYATLKAILLRSIMGIFGGGKTGRASAGVGAILAADGAAFSGGKIIPFAKGGIVTKPTIFPMARGMGLMGEAGPEAVVPLKRGSDGKLGIEGGGGTTYITVHINAIEPQSFAQAMRSNKAVVESVVVENIMRNGAVRSAIRGAV